MYMLVGTQNTRLSFCTSEDLIHSLISNKNCNSQYLYALNVNLILSSNLNCAASFPSRSITKH